MSAYIWTLPHLVELLDHPEPSVQEWTVNKWFSLYPESTQKDLPRFLADSRPAVVAAAVAQLGARRRDELVPLLRDIYLQGPPDTAAEAIRVLGEWQVTEAVDWMKQRILQGGGLQAKQISNMIYALGQIPTEEAWDLLKSTESSINEGGVRHWGNFYMALMNHRRLEDIGSIISVLGDPAQEERQLEAFGVLLGVIEPSLNPTEVFYGNAAAVQKQVQRRLHQMGSALPPDQIAAVTEGISKGWNELTSNEREALLQSFRRLLEIWSDQLASSFEYEIARKAAMAIRDVRDANSNQQALLALAWCALVAAIGCQTAARPELGGDWRKLLGYLLQDEPPRASDDVYVEEVVRNGDRAVIVKEIRDVLKETPGSWRAIRAIHLAGECRAEESLPELIHCLAASDDRFGYEAIQTAMTKIGSPVVPALVPLLASANPAQQKMAWTMLSKLPTEAGVRSQLANLPDFYRDDPEQALDMLKLSGAGAFLVFIEEEFRRGELNLGRAYLLLSRLNGIQNDRLADIERDVKRMEAGSSAQVEWPQSIALELGCAQCHKRYHYEVQEVHIHPPDKNDGETGDDYIPFHHGIVIRDDIRCKNCGTTNAIELTHSSRDRLTAEFVKVLAFTKAGIKIPSSSPVVLTNWPAAGEKIVTLRELERERLKGVEDHPSKPAAHLALGKFYEYVKQDGPARNAYLRALDLDSGCLEAMAGLARTDFAAGRLKQAVEWIESCYDQLETGHYYMVEDQAAFKRAARDARRQYTRELGVKPKDPEVEIRFRMETSEHPKNKPCPCGSGKKYKLCCMSTPKD